jgi:transcriptional regulator with GAF, ATPase, and Fis domain
MALVLIATPILIARSATPRDTLMATVGGIAGSSTILARAWLSDDAGQLRLAASAGTPSGGGTYDRLDGSFSVVPLGAGKIGRIAESREPFIVRGIRGDEPWLLNPSWAARQGVRTFAGFPLTSGGRVRGVVAVFDREILSDAALSSLDTLSTLAAYRLDDLDALSSLRLRVATLENARAAPPPLPTTRAELREVERQSIVAALTQSHGRVFGSGGAAERLAMKPTTLASRIKRLGISRVR